MAAMNARTKMRRRVVVDDRPLAAAIGRRLRAARLRAGLTQQQLAGERYTKAYVSALENGLVKPSMAALNYLAGRLGVTATDLLTDYDAAWARLQADLRLASGDFAAALDGYRELVETTTDRAARAGILAGMAEALYRLDRPAEAIAPAAEAAELFDGLGRAAEAAAARYWLAAAHHQRENHDEARALLRGILEAVRSGLSVTSDFRVRVLVALGLVEQTEGNHKAALAYLEEAQAIAAELDTRRRGTVLFSLAITYREVGDHEAAIRAGTKALALLEAADAEREAVNLQNHLALAYLATSSRDRASQLVAAARERARTLGDAWQLGHIVDTQAQIALAQGDAEAALALADEAVRAATEAGNSKARFQGLITRAKALAALGRHEDAVAGFAEAAELAKSQGATARLREVLSAWADELAALGRHDEAYALAREALEVAHR